MVSTTDHIDYVNGIGNHSHEQYVCIRDGCALRVIVEVDGFVEFYICIGIEVTVSKEQQR